MLLPIHRVVKRGLPAGVLREKLSAWRCSSAKIAKDASDIAAALEAHLAPHAGTPAFAADDGSGELLIFWRDEELGDDLMVRILEREILGGVFGLDADDLLAGAVLFPQSSPRAAEEARASAQAIALYLNPMSADDVFRITDAGERMPQKSTFFSPKVPTGLVFRVHAPVGE